MKKIRMATTHTEILKVNNLLNKIPSVNVQVTITLVDNQIIKGIFVGHNFFPYLDRVECGGLCNGGELTLETEEERSKIINFLDIEHFEVDPIHL